MPRGGQLSRAADRGLVWVMLSTWHPQIHGQGKGLDLGWLRDAALRPRDFKPSEPRGMGIDADDSTGTST